MKWTYFVYQVTGWILTFFYRIPKFCLGVNGKDSRAKNVHVGIDNSCHFVAVVKGPSILTCHFNFLTFFLFYFWCFVLYIVLLFAFTIMLLHHLMWYVTKKYQSYVGNCAGYKTVVILLWFPVAGWPVQLLPWRLYASTCFHLRHRYTHIDRDRGCVPIQGRQPLKCVVEGRWGHNGAQSTVPSHWN